MSKIKTQNPIIHTPTFKEFIISGLDFSERIRTLGYKLPISMLDSQYYYTDLVGWGKVLLDLAFKSNLYKQERFDCDNFSFKAMTECAERYGLNTLGVVIGDILQGRHAFNILFHGDGFKFFEPNAGFGYGGLFEIGDYGYRGDMVII